ncbi:hypothetical protein OJF2_71590 [Aquisphaera giovannonii]|uniref:Glycosyl transferase family 2 n=1 Tax=Aquisphaera giovannonii TaxID=406548 RepID=A0A5B9WD68_9BACT|nr:hypothetical protein [Aquisphaera giovannonii]QEH38556.1 hypothetical protein OJF2_71590 [Aquisphaera giovannonii]
MEPRHLLRVRGPEEALAALASVPPGAWLILSVRPGPLAEADAPIDSVAELLMPPSGTIAVLDPRLTEYGAEALAVEFLRALHRPGLMTLLVPPAEIPAVSGKNHGPVLSFVGPASLLAGSPAGPAGRLPEELCFLALRAVMHGAKVGVIARECPSRADDSPPWVPGEAGDAIPQTALIMAHRGPCELLRAALTGLAASDPAPDALRVGLDLEEDELGPYLSLAREFPRASFYVGSHAPVGPYVIRQAIADEAPEERLVFHDSDDLSTCDRFHWLHRDLTMRGPALVGSHELRYDEDDREVRAVRFPLDASAALAIEPKHPQLHPTTMLTAEGLRRSGGFSTDCVFGNDTQLMLRAYFHMPLRNVDRFLYIRRDRWESLTNAPETGMENPLRIARNIAWRSDFEAVRAGRMRLEDSSLMAIEGRGAWALRRLDAAR